MTAHPDTGAYIADLMNLNKSSLPSDGGERFNRLIFARSPYLLQHSENPVDWYEWGDDAFQKAELENRPIMLSIGYATCHWCHVMAHESFEDQEVADLLNRDYVCIKVDREERPDIDDFYMTVSQVLTGSGGWPLNIFMSPDKRPFFAMTYLPKRGRKGMSGFMDLLAHITNLWRNDPDRIEKNCSGIMDALGHLSQESPQKHFELKEVKKSALDSLSTSYDQEYGGFGTAPKFPMPINLSWLVEQGNSGNREALRMALHTLRAIRQGGIWDQLGGGLHRYSVDREWLVPHFEKMLYDQGMVALAALEAFQATGDSFYMEMAGNIFSFVTRELTSPQGGFYSALDADSEGVEGKFYLWDKQDVVDCLGTDAELFCSFYDISGKGNFEGYSIPNIPVSLEDFCRQRNLDPESTAQLLERCRLRLLDQRALRIRPLRDEKIITAWNGLMIAALARGGVVSGNRMFTDRAVAAAAFIMRDLKRPDGRLLRSYLNGPSDIPGFLEDYAFLCHSFIELFEATLDNVWLKEALLLADEIVRLFHAPSDQLFTKVGRDAEQMPIRASLEHDGVVPSSFSLAARCLARLGHAVDRPDLHDLAHVMLSGILSDASRHPTAYLGALQVVELLQNEPVIVTLRGQKDSAGIHELLQTAKSMLMPNMIIKFEETGHEGQAAVCAKGACRPPATEAQDLLKILASLH